MQMKYGEWGHISCVYTVLLICQVLSVYSSNGTWLEAYESCKENGSSIATTNQTGFWLPDFTFSTPWLSLIDCQDHAPNNSDVRVFDHPTDCVVYCVSLNMTFVMLRRKVNIECFCSNTATNKTTGKCSFCDETSSKLWCGVNDSSVAIYNVRHGLKFTSNPAEQCLSVTCENSLLKPYKCENTFSSVCTSQNLTGKACISFAGTPWMEYDKACPLVHYHQDESVCDGGNLKTCTGKAYSFNIWLHTIRETINCSVYLGHCVGYLQVVPDEENMLCSFVSKNGEKKMVSCNFSSYSFLCNTTSAYTTNLPYLTTQDNRSIESSNGNVGTTGVPELTTEDDRLVEPSNGNVGTTGVPELTTENDRLVEPSNGNVGTTGVPELTTEDDRLVEPSNGNVGTTGVPELTTENDRLVELPWMWIAVGGTGLFLLIFLTVFIICYKKSRKRDITYKTDLKNEISMDFPRQLETSSAGSTAGGINCPSGAKEICAEMNNSTSGEHNPAKDKNICQANNSNWECGYYTVEIANVNDNTVSNSARERKVTFAKSQEQNQDTGKCPHNTDNNSHLDRSETNIGNQTKRGIKYLTSPEQQKDIYDHLHDQRTLVQGPSGEQDESSMYMYGCMAGQKDGENIYNTFTDNYQQDLVNDYDHFPLPDSNDYDNLSL